MKVIFFMVGFSISTVLFGQNISNNLQPYLLPTTGGCNIVYYLSVGFDFSKIKSDQRTWNGRCNANKRIEGYGVVTEYSPDTNIKVNTTSNFQNGMEQGPTTVEVMAPNYKKIFSGTFVNGSKSYGTEKIEFIQTNRTSVYEGNYKDGKYWGSGTYYLKTPQGETRYIGNFENGTYNGSGTMYFLGDNQHWMGNFTNGKMNGMGTTFFGSGGMSKVQYVNGEIVYQAEVPPPELTPEQLRQIFPPQQSITPFSCFTYGGITNCR